MTLPKFAPFLGQKIVEPSPRPETTLLSYLRLNLRLCGTKLGCGEGGCGACTVMVSSYHEGDAHQPQGRHHQNNIRHVSVNACLTPVVAMHGKAVTTVEGIGSVKYIVIRFGRCSYVRVNWRARIC